MRSALSAIDGWTAQKLAYRDGRLTNALLIRDDGGMLWRGFNICSEEPS